jgi:hypothetical protein
MSRLSMWACFVIATSLVELWFQHWETIFACAYWTGAAFLMHYWQERAHERS